MSTVGSKWCFIQTEDVYITKVQNPVKDKTINKNIPDAVGDF